MKKIFITLGVVSILFAACTKEDNDPEQSTYTIDGVSYTTGDIATSGSTIVQAYTADATFGVTFNDTTQTSGSYNIVRYPDSAGQVQVFALVGSKEYRSTGLDNKTLDVVVNGAKMTITIPPIWAKDDATGDSVLMSGKIVKPEDF